MIRPFTCICMLLAGGSGLYLYQSKHTAQLLDREIARTVKLADAARERAGVLSAEYALLNDPQRLADLADEHLPSLKKTAPTQFTTWAELGKRLPPVGAPAIEAPPLEPEAPTAKLPEQKPEAKPDTARPVAAAPPVVATASPATAPASPPAPAVAAAAPARPATPAPAPRPAPVLARPAAPAQHPAALVASLQVPPVAAAAVHAPAAPAHAAPAPPGPRPVSLTASLQPQGVPATAAPVHMAAVSLPPAPPPARPLPASPPAHSAARASASTTPPAGNAGEPVTHIARSDAARPAVASALGMARSMGAPAAVTPVSAPSIWQPGGSQQSVTQ